MNTDPTLFNYRKNQLYYGNKKTNIKLIKDPHYPGMWWIETESGKIEDFYNHARAKEHGIALATEDMKKIV